MSEFKPGEIVDITIKGARVEEPTDEVGNLEYSYPAGLSRFEGVIVPLAESVTVERVAPAEWPPQPGDLWRDKHGESWFAFSDKAVDLLIPAYPVNASRGGRQPGDVLETHGPLTLVYREGGEGS